MAKPPKKSRKRPDPPREVPPEWDRAITFAIEGKTFCDAAEDLGVDRRTLYRWRQDPAYRKRLAEVQDEVFASARGDLKASTDLAVETLRTCSRGGDLKEAPRVPAARAILQFAIELRKQDNLDARMRRIEDALGLDAVDASERLDAALAALQG